MIEKQLDIWSMLGKAPICITTNGFVKTNGRAVAGRGVAKQACEHIPGFAEVLGDSIQEYGNVVRTMYVPVTGVRGAHVLSFPVKPISGICEKYRTNVVDHMKKDFSPGEIVPGWAMRASLSIIQRSLWELFQWAEMHVPQCGFVYLPKPGCGAGGLAWRDIRPLCEKYGGWLVCVTK